MKTITIFETPSGNYSRNPGPGWTPVSAVFLHCKSNGDYNRVTYLDKPSGTTKREIRENLFFIGEITPEAKAELIRGKTFLTKKDGFLFGALAALRKHGQLVTTLS